MSEKRIVRGADQIAQLRGLTVGGWRAGRSKDCTNWSLRTMNLNTARVLARKGLVQSPFSDGGTREKIFPGDPLEITQAGRDWLKENGNAGDPPQTS